MRMPGFTPSVQTRPIENPFRFRPNHEFGGIGGRLQGQLPEPVVLIAPGENFRVPVSSSRASTAWRTNHLGQTVSVAQNEAAWDYNPSTLAFRGLRSEPLRTNSIRNPRGEGAVVGTIGSGGVLPTNWLTESSAGLTTEVLEVVSVSGIQGIRFRVSGVPNFTSYQLRFEVANNIVAATGQTWAGSFYAQRTGGSLNNISAVRCEVVERDASGAFLTSGGNNITLPTTSVGRFGHTRTLSNVGTLRVSNRIGLSLTVGNPVDIESFVGYPQLEQGPYTTSLTLPPPGTLAASTRAPDANILTQLERMGFNPAEGTIVCEFETMGEQSGGTVYLFGTDGNDSIHLRRGVGLPTELIPFVTVGTVNQAALTSSGVGSNVIHRHVFAWKQNDFASCLNRGSVLTDNTGTIPTVSALRIGCSNSSNGEMGGWMSYLLYYPARLPNNVLPLL